MDSQRHVKSKRAKASAKTDITGKECTAHNKKQKHSQNRGPYTWVLSSHVSHFTPKRIALLALLTALGCIGRWLFAVPFLPNIQPMTTILLLVTLHFGVVDGIIVSILSILLTNMLLGMGPWTLHQIGTYMIVMALTGILRPLYARQTPLHFMLLTLYAGLVGLLYGFIISIFSVYMYQMPSFLAYYMRGIPFDMLHGLGNIGFFSLLVPILRPILEKKFPSTP
ncbi:ECF transporter S component [Allofustis seminis]|uniref:ECF transporter S component n=1 Tax=Allofustis seminis TaxID=166939 RepID=UPI00039D4CAA|nr:ECF transporter S component [Allofustis seminis]